MIKPVNHIILILMTAFFLAGCGKTDIEEKELVFIDKIIAESSLFSPSVYRLYFEDVDNKRYIYVSVSSWEFDHYDEEKGNTIMFDYTSETWIDYESIKVNDKFRRIYESEKSFIILEDE